MVAPRRVARVVAVVTLVCLLCHLTSWIVYGDTATFTSTVPGLSASIRGLQNVNDVSRSDLRVDSQHGLDKTQTDKVRHSVRVFCFQWENYRHKHARVLLGALGVAKTLPGSTESLTPSFGPDKLEFVSFVI